MAMLTLPLVALGMVVTGAPSVPPAPASAHGAFDDMPRPIEGVAVEAVLRSPLPPSVQAMVPLPRPAGSDLLALAPPRDPDETLRFGGMRIRRGLAETVVRAGTRTDVDPVYLLALADKESSFTTGAKASTSSAEGMFQFIDSTWLRAVKEFGPSHGLSDEAAKITIADDKVTVDPSARNHILGIRRDAYLSAVMAAELLKRDRRDISARIGRELSRPEFYLSHFLGFEGATRFMTLLGDSPQVAAPKAFPAAAKANRRLFYALDRRKARPKTIAEVYQGLVEAMGDRIERYANLAHLVTR